MGTEFFQVSGTVLKWGPRSGMTLVLNDTAFTPIFQVGEIREVLCLKAITFSALVSCCLAFAVLSSVDYLNSSEVSCDEHKSWYESLSAIQTWLLLRGITFVVKFSLNFVLFKQCNFDLLLLYILFNLTTTILYTCEELRQENSYITAKLNLNYYIKHIIE